MKIFFERININRLVALLTLTAMSGMVYAGQSAPAIVQGPALGLSIKHYDRVMTAEGVLRESRYEETMLRRPGHVWVARVLPKFAAAEHGGHAHHEHGAESASAAGHNDEHEHKHFNPVVLPRHITLEGGNLKIAFVDRTNKELINIVATEYENVNFDGSWVNAYFLVDPQLAAAMPLSDKPSAVAGARWHEQEKHGVFQRVLWDDKNMIPLEVETGKRDGTILRRVSVKLDPRMGVDAPWKKLQGYAQREYSDFLD